MFNKQKKTEKDEVVVAPVPTPPEEISGKDPKSEKSTNSSGEPNVFVKIPPSVLSSDLIVKGNLLTAGDIQIEGKVEGDIQAHLLTVGETSEIKGEIIADDVIINGKVIGCVRA